MNALFGIVISTSAAPAVGGDFIPVAAQEIAIEEWQPAKGDRFIADTRANRGYLVHEDGSYAEILIATGRREVVRYIGRTYNATTPTGYWVAKSLHIQSDRITFGPEGHFMRLYKDGTDRTAYGIHDYAYLDKVLQDDIEGRFYSMGCILVAKPILDMLEEAYKLNGGQLEVVTTYGLDEALIAKH